MTQDLIRIAVLSAVCTWGLTQAVKPTLKRFAADSWARSGVRIAALAIGSAVGFCILTTSSGAAAGCAGAALSAVVVAAIRRRIK